MFKKIALILFMLFCVFLIAMSVLNHLSLYSIIKKNEEKAGILFLKEQLNIISRFSKLHFYDLLGKCRSISYAWNANNVFLLKEFLLSTPEVKAIYFTGEDGLIRNGVPENMVPYSVYWNTLISYPWSQAWNISKRESIFLYDSKTFLLIKREPVVSGRPAIIFVVDINKLFQNIFSPSCKKAHLEATILDEHFNILATSSHGKLVFNSPIENPSPCFRCHLDMSFIDEGKSSSSIVRFKYYPPFLVVRKKITLAGKKFIFALSFPNSYIVTKDSSRIEKSIFLSFAAELILFSFVIAFFMSKRKTENYLREKIYHLQRVVLLKREILKKQDSLQSVIDWINFGIFIAKDQDIFLLNKALCNMVVGKEKCDQSEFYESFSPGVRQKLKSKLSELSLVSEPKASIVLPLEAKGGSTRYLECILSIMPFKDDVATIGVVKDITFEEISFIKLRNELNANKTLINLFITSLEQKSISIFLDGLCAFAKDYFGVEKATFYTYFNDQDILKPEFGYSIKRKEIENDSIIEQASKKQFFRRLEKGEFIISENPEEGTEISFYKKKYPCSMIAPILFKKKVYGVFAIASSKKNRTWDTDEKEFFKVSVKYTSILLDYMDIKITE